jgi:cysteinyl-tRNA synthetase
MEIRLYNTLTRSTEPLVPTTPGKVRVYCCGPTVYDVPHAGHARSAVAFDVLVRVLRANGLEVTHVRNVTDIDDKILDRAKKNGETPLDLSRRMTTVYREDMSAIGCGAPDHEPRVSDHLPQIIAMIQKLVAAGAAYEVEMPGGTRDVYFSVRSFPGYGKLSRRKIDELVAGARVEVGENKRDPLDFALWKGAPPEEWAWESPWGRGLPGWHIECSAMCSRYLGHGFEIHGGGMDLVFPHHENEIAQSEAAEPDKGPFAKMWMHNGFVNVDMEKMSKSLGNFVTVRDVLARNDAEAFRWFLLTVHYRGPIQFETATLPDGRTVFPGVIEAERRVDYMYGTLERMRGLVGAGLTAPAKLPKELLETRKLAEEAKARASAALADDLNTSVALAELGEIAKQGNEVADIAAKRSKDAAFVGASAVIARIIEMSLRDVADQLGVLGTSSPEYRARTRARRLALRKITAEDIEGRIREREEARKAKDFARSDAIRADLAAQGVALHDGPQGVSWTVDV